MINLSAAPWWLAVHTKYVMKMINMSVAAISSPAVRSLSSINIRNVLRYDIYKYILGWARETGNYIPNEKVFNAF